MSTRPILLLVAAVLAAVMAACGGSGTVEISRQSEPREDGSADDQPSRTGDFAAYCDTATEVRGSLEFDEDPWTGLDSLAELAELAPGDLRGDFDLAIERLGQFEMLDEGDASSFSRVLEILLDPELLDALGAIDTFTLDACGFTLDPSAAGEDSDSGLNVPEFDDEPFGDDETSISLDDIDEIKDDNEDASWADKISGTFIGGSADVQLSADVELFSDAEALELCDVMLAGLSTKNPGVSITVLNDSEPVASSSNDGSCSLD